MPNNPTTFALAGPERARLERGAGTMADQLREDIAVVEALERVGRRAWAGLAEAEQNYLRDLLGSTWMEPASIPSLPAMLAMEVEDGAALDGLDAKWEVDAKTLAGKLRAMHPADAWAIYKQARGA
ncbi:MAG: hypothetical protein C4525_03270 [Desulfarculus sp.]|jgi:hypothetical protein|nr:MAG: hypothetical protein C4525_03270 [Desulfarculus sp.]